MVYSLCKATSLVFKDLNVIYSLMDLQLDLVLPQFKKKYWSCAVLATLSIRNCEHINCLQHAAGAIPVLQSVATAVMAQPVQQQQPQQIQSSQQQQRAAVTATQSLTIQTSIAEPQSPELSSPASMETPTVVYPSTVHNLPVPVVRPSQCPQFLFIWPL